MSFPLVQNYSVSNSDMQQNLNREQKKDERNVCGKNTGEMGINVRNLCRATQRRMSRTQRTASDAHVSSEIPFIWHRGTIALLTRIAIVLLFLRNKSTSFPGKNYEHKFSSCCLPRNQKLHLLLGCCYSPTRL